MALSEEARILKGRLSKTVTLRKMEEALKEEWRELAQTEEAIGEELVWQLLLEQRALRRQWAKSSLQNWVAMRGAPLNERRRELLYRRYVKGDSWAQIVRETHRSKGYLLREHNRALEQLVSRASLAA